MKKIFTVLLSTLILFLISFSGYAGNKRLFPCNNAKNDGVFSSCTLTVTVVNNNTTCYSGNNGTATATPSGGIPPYTYAWTAGGGTNATATGLAAGTYSVTVTDSNGCIYVATTNIIRPLFYGWAGQVS